MPDRSIVELYAADWSLVVCALSSYAERPDVPADQARRAWSIVELVADAHDCRPAETVHLGQQSGSVAGSNSRE